MISRAVFGSHLNALRWNGVTSTDPGLFQSPLRAGIAVKPNQLAPLRKALRMLRVSLFIADDVGPGKTIEAGLILRERLLRQKVHRVVVNAPPSVMQQWKGEMESRFELGFAGMDRATISEMRRQRAWGINPRATHTRFILSQALVRDEAHAGPLRDWLGEEGKQALLILDQAHNTKPANGSKVAIDSNLTRAIRDLAGRFEHKLFLSATPHKVHGNSFTALLEILDPTRFGCGMAARKQDLEDVMVRHHKEDLRQIGVELPERLVVPEVIDGLPSNTPELRLAAAGRRAWRRWICSPNRSMATTSGRRGTRRSCCRRPMPNTRWRSPQRWKPTRRTARCPAAAAPAGSEALAVAAEDGAAARGVPRSAGGERRSGSPACCPIPPRCSPERHWRPSPAI